MLTTEQPPSGGPTERPGPDWRSFPRTEDVPEHVVALSRDAAEFLKEQLTLLSARAGFLPCTCRLGVPAEKCPYCETDRVLDALWGLVGRLQPGGLHEPPQAPAADVRPTPDEGARSRQ